jgi:hypothetical protein
MRLFQPNFIYGSTASCSLKLQDCPRTRLTLPDQSLEGQSWKELKEDGSSKGIGDTEVIPLVGAARSSKVNIICAHRAFWSISMQNCEQARSFSESR